MNHLIEYPDDQNSTILEPTQTAVAREKRQLKSIGKSKKQTSKEEDKAVNHPEPQPPVKHKFLVKNNSNKTIADTGS